MRFVEKRLPVEMVEAACRSLSVETYKDLEMVISVIEKRNVLRELYTAINNYMIWSIAPDCLYGLWNAVSCAASMKEVA